jgi:pimeloyl-ACP methyl ester carboxylesterase
MIEKVNDVEFYCERFGSGIPVVMIHGWSPDHRIVKNCMEPLFRHFPGVFERLYFDLPGMGRTRGGEGIASTDDMLDRVRALIERLVPGKKYLLVGESYGGYLARGLVRLDPERVLGLCLICPIAARDTQKVNAAPFSVLEKEPGIDAIMDDDDRKYYSDMTVRQTAATLSRFREEIMPGLKMADHAWIAGHFGKRASFEKDVDDPAARYPFPALFLAGRQDSSVGYSDLWQILEIYPRAAYCVLDMAGHNLQLEQPELFDALAREWLERVLLEARRA